MNPDIRREIIGENLGIKPINHGQIHTFQIAIPDSRKQPLSLDQRQAIETSLLAHQSNLVSLIVRRTTAYTDEDIEYELVYGADWLQVAQGLEIEKVWAWVFDMTDDQAIAAIAEMESLTGSQSTPFSTQSSNGLDVDIAALIDAKLQLVTDSIKNSITPLLHGIRSDLDEKLKILHHRFDNISGTTADVDGLKTVSEKLDAIQQKLDGKKIQTVENPINLLEASDEDIEAALKQVNTQKKQIRAAIDAVRFWQQSERGLTWNNLNISVKAETTSPNKIAGFADGTYKQLQRVAYIPEGDTQ